MGTENRPSLSIAELRGGEPERSRPDDRSTDRHRRLIGWIGLLLPGAMAAVVLAYQGYDAWKKLDSISAYFYSFAVAAFVGMLVSLALFLLTYRGFRNAGNKWDGRLTNWAAIAALGVAAFPTKPPPGIDKLAWWSDWMGYVHLACAVALFSLFAVISGWLFTMKHTRKFWPTIAHWLAGWRGADARSRSKDNRDRFHFFCAVVIVLAMLAAAYCWAVGWQIFWAEWVALAAFALSWLVKGRVKLRRALRDGATDFAQLVKYQPERADRDAA